MTNFSQVFTHRVVIVAQVLLSVAVREHQKLGVAVESNVGGEFARDRGDELRERFRFYIGESSASTVCFGAWVAAGTTL